MIARAWKSIRRVWSMLTEEGARGGLVKPGSWRVVYPDGLRSRWISYGDADTLRIIHGGRLEWKGDEGVNLSVK